MTGYLVNDESPLILLEGSSYVLRNIRLPPWCIWDLPFSASRGTKRLGLLGPWRWDRYFVSKLQ